MVGPAFPESFEIAHAGFPEFEREVGIGVHARGEFDAEAAHEVPQVAVQHDGRPGAALPVCLGQAAEFAQQAFPLEVGGAVAVVAHDHAGIAGVARLDGRGGQEEHRVSDVFYFFPQQAVPVRQHVHIVVEVTNIVRLYQRTGNVQAVADADIFAAPGVVDIRLAVEPGNGTVLSFVHVYDDLMGKSGVLPQPFDAQLQAFEIVPGRDDYGKTVRRIGRLGALLQAGEHVAVFFVTQGFKGRQDFPNGSSLPLRRTIDMGFSTDTFRNWAAGPAAPAESTWFWAALLVVSMPLSPFLMSIAMWGLVFTAFWQQGREEALAPRPGWRAWRLLSRSFANLFRQRALAVFTLLLLVPALSGLWSEDLHYWLERVRVRLPFLVLPWAFANLPRLSERQFRGLLYLLVWLMVILCLWVFVHFFLHQQEILHAMYQGRPMPTPRNHIRFSLIVATAALSGAWLWQQRFVWRDARERTLLGLATLFLFFFLHFLAVRSGLAAFYAALLFTGLRWVWYSRRWGVALAALGAGGLILYGAVRTLPSLKQKWEYTVYDWKQYTGNTGHTYSDSERWVSLKAGMAIWRAHPWLGAGAGDLPRETERFLAAQYPEYLPTPKLPHNQFVYLLAGVGLLGLALSLVAFLFPVFAVRHGHPTLFYAFQVMVFSSFMVEYTIETAMGVAWYLFYTLWFLMGQKNSG